MPLFTQTVWGELPAQPPRQGPGLFSQLLRSREKPHTRMGTRTTELLRSRQGGRWAHWTVTAQQPTVPGPRTVPFQGWSTSGRCGQSQDGRASPVLLLGELGRGSLVASPSSHGIRPRREGHFWGTGISLSPPPLPSCSGWGSARAAGARGSSRSEGQSPAQERSILAPRLRGPVLQGGVFAVHRCLGARLQVWLCSRGLRSGFPGLPRHRHRGSLAGVAPHLRWTQWAEGPGVFPEEQGVCGWSSGTRVK